MSDKYKIKISLNQFKIYDNSENTGQIDMSKTISFMIPISQNLANLGLNSNHEEEWDSESVYKNGSICCKNNVVYYSITDNNINKNPENTLNIYWAKKNEDEVWETNKVYDINKKVKFGDFYYISLTENNVFDINDKDKWFKCVGNYTTNTKIESFRKYKEPYFEVGFIMNKDVVGSDNYVDYIKHTKSQNGETLYEYVFSEKNLTDDSGIKYSEIGNGLANVYFPVNGENSDDFSQFNTIHQDYMNGVSEPPKIESNLFIDRGNNTSFEKHFRLGEILSIDDFTSQGDNFYKIQTID